MNPYHIDTSNTNLAGPLASLNIVYNAIPEMRGCERCEEVNGEDATWCCRGMNPSMYYIEFLRVWKSVQNNWKKKDKVGLLVRSIANYLSCESSKGCVFWQEKCLCYKDRPFYCRLYGLIPEDSWDKKVSAIKTYDPDFTPRDQCDLVSLKDDKKAITEQQENKWFEHIHKAEKRIGMPDQVLKLHDLPGGPYRTFHDHIMLEAIDPQMLNTLTQIKISKPTKEKIQLFVNDILRQLGEKEII